MNSIHGIEFRTTDLRKYRDQARDLAVEAAQERTLDLSGALDMQIGAPISIQEGSMSWWYWGSNWWGSGNYTMSQNAVQNAGGSGAGMESGIPGKISVRANVSVVFEMSAAP